MPTERLITVESSFPHEETVQRLEAAVREGGMTPFAHVDHSAGAAGVRDWSCGPPKYSSLEIEEQAFC